MAGELQALAPTGSTVYGQVLSEAAGTIWNTAGAALENYATANIADYDITPVTQQGTASGYWVADMPAAPAGRYTYDLFVRAGGSPAETDTILCSGGVIDWSGTSVSEAACEIDTTTGLQKVTWLS